MAKKAVQKTTKAKPKVAAKKTKAKTKAKSVTKAKSSAKKKPAKTAKKPAARKVVPKKASAAKKPTKKRAVAAKKTVKARKTAPKKVTARKTAAKKAAPRVNLITPTQNAMEKTMTQSTKQFENFAQDANDLGRESVEAFIKSGTIFAKGFEDIFRTGMSLAQTAAEKQAQYAKAAMSSKTLNEWAEAQSKIAQANFDDFVQSATQISEMSAKVLNEASEPLNAQLTKSIKKATKAAA